jgi:hypothetical protein
VSRSEIPTARVSLAPVVLAVGLSADLTKRCREAAIAGQALLVEAGIASTATMAAQTRPLAIVILEDVYAFDADSFDALAIDVNAQIVRLTQEDIPQEELEDLIVNAIGEAELTRSAASERE